MKQRKLLLIMLSCIMVLTFASCGKEDKGAAQDQKVDAYAEFTKVQKSMEDIKDAEMKMDIDMKVASGESTKAENVKMTMDAQMVMLSKDKAANMKMKYHTAGETAMDGTIYMKGNNMYMDMAGQKLKIKADSQVSELTSMMKSDQFMNIQKEMVKDCTMEKSGDNTVYKIKMDPTKALDYMKNTTGDSAIQSLGDMMDVNDMDLTITVGKDNMVKSIDTVSTMTTDIADQKSTMDYKVKMEYVSINTGLKIKFPDFSEYEEMSMGS